MKLLNLKCTINRIALIIILNILFLFFQSILTECREFQNNENNTIRSELSVGRFTYIYESIDLQKKRAPDIKSQIKGKITIIDSRKKENHTIYEEILVVTPRALSESPILFKLPKKMAHNAPEVSEESKWYVIFHGDCAGRNNVMKVFYYHDDSLVSTTLSFGDGYPNVEDKNGDGIYEAQVFRRITINDIVYGYRPYLTVYKLYNDHNLFGFVPSFDRKVAHLYLEYYNSIKQSITQSGDRFSNEDIGPMLAALSAIQDEKIIHSEIKFLNEKFDLVEKNLMIWKERLIRLGYPELHVSDFRR